tara:strand:- start:1887 stop:2708 length:822 start_codon:yes stop_codon:yes gene_type:complete
MVQGFYTKPTMDLATLKLFKSIPDGLIHGRPSYVTDQWERTQWQTFKSVEQGPCVCFGILRGTGEIIRECQDKGVDFYYGDHSYIFTDTFKKEKSYRITKNNFQVNKMQELTKNEIARAEKIKNNNINPAPWKERTGHYILVCPPSKYVTKYFLDDKDWLAETEKVLMENTDRPIKVRTKDTQTPLDKDISHAHAVVTYNSTVAIHAILNGVPVFCDGVSVSNPVSSSNFADIETPFYPENRVEWLNWILSNQFTFEEMSNGYAWSKLNDKVS